MGRKKIHPKHGNKQTKKKKNHSGPKRQFFPFFWGGGKLEDKKINFHGLCESKEALVPVQIDLKEPIRTHTTKWLSYTLLYKMASKTSKISQL